MTRRDNAHRPALGAFVGMAALALALTACTNGDDGGGRFAGIEGTGIVSGFGSVYVDGIEFQTDDVAILFVGEQVSESALSVGDLVHVSGRVDDAGRAHAQRIVFERTLDGPIDSIRVDNGQGQLRALGQTVRFDEDTTFVNVPREELAAGDLIAVSGFVDASNVVHAESIRRSDTGFVPNESRLEIEGRIDNVEGTQLSIGNQIIEFDAARISPQTSAIEAGRWIEAFGRRAADSSAALIADEVNVREIKSTQDGRRTFVEAVIRDYEGPSNFVAGGWRIDASHVDRIDELADQLAPGARISVRGTFEGDRVRADTLTLEQPAAATWQATIEALDAGEQTIRILGQTVALPDDTQYVDRRDAGDRRLRIDALAPNDPVRIHVDTAGARPVVRRLERIDHDGTNQATVTGPVERIEPSDGGATWVASGVAARTASGTTTYRDVNGNALAADAFFARIAAGDRVKLTGPSNAGEISIVRDAQILDGDTR